MVRFIHLNQFLILSGVVLTSLPGVAPNCVDSTEAIFSYKKYNDKLIFKTEKTDRKCKSLEQENDITIKMNCANKFEIADNCK